MDTHNTTAVVSPIARGPLLEMHRRGGATLIIENGWEIAQQYPTPSQIGANVIVDLSHWFTYEVNGPNTAKALETLCGSAPPVRTIKHNRGQYVYSLVDRRAIVFCPAATQLEKIEVIDVTGGWATISLLGPDVETILNKVTAVDLRSSTLPPGTCCQGPIFGVNTLFGRFDNRFDLHVCTDSAEFFWEVLLDAGQEFDLRPAGTSFFSEVAS